MPDNRKDAKRSLKKFLEQRFKFFGTYEDAMQEQQNFLFHSMLSPLLNVGLLTPKEVIDSALNHAESNDIPLNSLEGFIRQIIGWREFIRGVYQEKSEIEFKSNYWDHKNKINSNWYKGTTGLDPLDDVIRMVKTHQNSPELTRTHQNSPELARTHQNLSGETRGGAAAAAGNVCGASPSD